MFGEDLLWKIAGSQIFTTEDAQSIQIHRLSPKFPASLGAWTRLTLTDVAILELSNRFRQSHGVGAMAMMV